MSLEANKELVRRYYREVVDQANLEILAEFFTEDCIIHRPEASGVIKGLAAFRRHFERALDVYSSIKTTLHDIIAEGDRVVCRMSHRATNRGAWTSRVGTHQVAGKSATWGVIAIFRFKDGKMAEEWVCRDELGMLLELGVLSSA